LSPDRTKQPLPCEQAVQWSFLETNGLSSINWSNGRKLIEPAVKEFEDKAFDEVPNVEKKVVELVKAGKNEEAKQYVTDYTNSFAYSAMRKWQAMKGTLWSTY
jgi:hypothetical protein